MSSPVVWNPFTNNLDFVGPGGTSSGVNSIAVNNGLAINSATGNVTISGLNATTSERGVASFNPAFFSVNNGAVSLLGVASGTATTVGALTANVVTIPLANVVTTYNFKADVAGMNSGGVDSCGYAIWGCIRTNGTTATLVGNRSLFNEDPALEAANAYFTVSGNNAILQVLGVTALTINWAATTTQISVT